MKTISLKGNGLIKVWSSFIDIDVPHLEEKFTYHLPLLPSANYMDAARKVDSRKLHMPTTAQFISLIDLVMQNPEQENCFEILSKFNNFHLWTSTEIITFKNGSLVYDNVDGSMPRYSASLLRLFDERDERVRLVSSFPRMKKMPIKEFLRSPYIVAQIGENMLESAERVISACNPNEAYFDISINSLEDEHRVTSLRNLGMFALDNKDPISNNATGYFIGIVPNKIIKRS